MALALSFKVSPSLTRLDLDKEPKKESVSVRVGPTDSGAELVTGDTLEFVIQEVNIGHWVVLSSPGQIHLGSEELCYERLTTSSTWHSMFSLVSVNTAIMSYWCTYYVMFN